MFLNAHKTLNIKKNKSKFGLNLIFANLKILSATTLKFLWKLSSSNFEFEGEFKIPEIPLLVKVYLYAINILQAE